MLYAPDKDYQVSSEQTLEAMRTIVRANQGAHHGGIQGGVGLQVQEW